MKKIFKAVILFLFFAVSLYGGEATAGKAYSTVLMLVDETTYQTYNDQIDQYKIDIESNFPVRINIITGLWTTAEQVRNVLQEHFETYGIEGSILVGNIPLPRFKLSQGAETGQIKLFPYYYQQLDDVIFDNDNDGISDYIARDIDEIVDIWTSFIIPLSDPNAITIGDFFEKTHNYYIGETPINRKGLSFASESAESWHVAKDDYANAMELLGLDAVIRNSHDVDDTLADYLHYINDETYQINAVFTHATSFYQQFRDNDLHGFTILEFPADSGALINLIYGCNSGNLLDNQASCTALSYIMNNTVSQASFACTRSMGNWLAEQIIEKLAAGENMGKAYLLYYQFKNYTDFIDANWEDTPNQFIYDYVLYGNPFLKIQKTILANSLVSRNAIEDPENNSETGTAGILEGSFTNWSEGGVTFDQPASKLYFDLWGENNLFLGKDEFIISCRMKTSTLTQYQTNIIRLGDYSTADPEKRAYLKLEQRNDRLCILGMNDYATSSNGSGYNLYNAWTNTDIFNHLVLKVT
jgi:hypothetical protein